MRLSADMHADLQANRSTRNELKNVSRILHVYQHTKARTCMRARARVCVHACCSRSKFRPVLYVYTSRHTRMHVCSHVRMHTRTRACMHVRVCACTCAHVRVYACVQACVHECRHAGWRACTCACAHVGVHSCTCVHASVCVCTCVGAMRHGPMRWSAA